MPFDTPRNVADSASGISQLILFICLLGRKRAVWLGGIEQTVTMDLALDGAKKLCAMTDGCHLREVHQGH